MPFPRSCSGETYPGVPTMLPASVKRSLVSASGHRIVLSDRRESKIQHLHLSSRRDDDVLRFDVAVNNAGGVRFGQRLRRLYADIHHVAGRERGFPDPLGKALAVDVLHGDENVAVRFADFVNGADVGMVERGSGLGLVDQPLPGLRTAGQRLGQHLDGDFARERTVFREKDLSHAARAELPDDSVVADLCRVPQIVSNASSSAPAASPGGATIQRPFAPRAPASIPRDSGGRTRGTAEWAPSQLGSGSPPAASPHRSMCAGRAMPALSVAAEHLADEYGSAGSARDRTRPSAGTRGTLSRTHLRVSYHGASARPVSGAEGAVLTPCGSADRTRLLTRSAVSSAAACNTAMAMSGRRK